MIRESCRTAMMSMAVFVTSCVQTCYADLTYTIGNSLTWDTVPALLDGDVAWHVDCGKNLQFIHDNPSAPCVTSSTIWPTALASEHYDFVTIQPFPGTTLGQDVTIISEWMSMQSHAVFVIHTGWAQFDLFEQEYHGGNPNDNMIRSPEYFDDLIDELRSRNPGRVIRRTRAIELLDIIYHDVQESKAPFNEFSDLYRDSYHMTYGEGRYLMHNAMRLALGQPMSDAGFTLDSDTKVYLDSKLEAVTVPEPTSSSYLFMVMCASAVVVWAKAILRRPGREKSPLRVSRSIYALHCFRTSAHLLPRGWP